MSAALVIHHFGSKDGLRKACDDYVAEEIRSGKSEAMRSSDPATWFAAMAEIEEYAPMMAYLVRSMQSGGDLAKTLWRTMIDNAESYLDEGVRTGMLKPSRDPAARAKYLAITGGGGFLLYIQMHETPTDLRAVLRDYAADMVLPALELYTEGLMTDSHMYDAFLAQKAEGEARCIPIEIHDLTKNFGAVRALDGLDLTVREGEVHGFLGPNGAGKSTTIRILLGVVKADGGTVRLLGGDPWHDAVELHRQIAYVPGDVTLWPNLTGGETIDLLARMRGGIDEQAACRADRALRARPAQEGADLLQGQPPESLADLGILVAGAAAAARRAEQRPGPVDGEHLSAMRRRSPRSRRDGAAVQPHPGRDRGAVRASDDHPRRQDGRERHAGFDATPQPDVDHRRLAPRPRRSHPDPRRRGRQLSTEPRCTPTSTARDSANSSGYSATPACAAWSASRPPWKNSSCAITAPTGSAN